MSEELKAAQARIACLEGEIAKRDARIVELESEVRSWVIRIQQRGLEMDEMSDERDQLRAELAAIKAQDTVDEVVGWYRLDRPYEMTPYPSVCATWHKLGAPVAPLYAAPAAPAADASDVLDQAMYTLISIGYHENSGLVHELRQALAAHSAKGVV